jgi:predicted nucleic acid-binding protein
MAFSAVLDTNVLYRFSLRDTLLRLAELELYTPLWSARIFKEMARNLVEHQITEQQAARVQTAMRETLLRKLKATPRGIDRPSLR